MSRPPTPSEALHLIVRILTPTRVGVASSTSVSPAQVAQYTDSHFESLATAMGDDTIGAAGFEGAFYRPMRVALFDKLCDGAYLAGHGGDAESVRSR